MKNKNGLDTYLSSCAAALRLLGFVTLTIVLVPVHAGLVLVHPHESFKIPQLYYQLLLKVLGFRVRVHGQIETKQPVMYVSNHTSYLDVPVLGSLIPAAFVAKSDVADWPFIGPLAKMQGTLFVERQRGRVGDQRDYLSGHLAKGKSLIIFPEGTSTLGLSVLPFKSSLFSIVENMPETSNLTIQPISVLCTELDGLPMTRAWRPFYAWYGDMAFFGHFWSMLKVGRFTIDVVFHSPVTRTTFADRKELAVYCHQQVARGIEQGLTGRETATASVPRLPAPV